MMKHKMRIVTLALLLVCLIVIPLVGVNFGGYDSPSVFQKGSVVTTRLFGGGTSVYLEYSEEDVTVDDATLDKTVSILQARLESLGYTDSLVEREGNQIRADIPTYQYIDAIFAQVASIGEWSLIGPSSSEALCDASMVEDASVIQNSNGYYAVELKFTKEGAEKFKSNTQSFALTGSYIYLAVDGSYITLGSVPLSIEDTYTIGMMDYSTAAETLAYIKNGALPAKMIIDRTNDFAPTLPGTLLIVLYAIVAAIVLLPIVYICVKGKSAGVFSAMSLIANVFVLLTVLVNQVIMLNIPSLITMLLCFLLAAYFQLKAVTPLGTVLQSGKKITSGNLAELTKFSMKGIWIHAAIFIVTLICYLFARGNFVYIVMATLISTVTNFATYFVFTFFGCYTLSAMQASRK